MQSETKNRACGLFVDLAEPASSQHARFKVTTMVCVCDNHPFSGRALTLCVCTRALALPRLEPRRIADSLTGMGPRGLATGQRLPLIVALCSRRGFFLGTGALVGISCRRSRSFS